jgi:hypothetical protein
MLSAVFSITARSCSAGPTRITIEPDGNVSIASLGIYDIITLPGQGMLIKNVGRLVLDGSGNVIFEAGTQSATAAGEVPDRAASLKLCSAASSSRLCGRVCGRSCADVSIGATQGLGEAIYWRCDRALASKSRSIRDPLARLG